MLKDWTFRGHVNRFRRHNPLGELHNQTIPFKNFQASLDGVCVVSQFLVSFILMVPLTNQPTVLEIHPTNSIILSYYYYIYTVTNPYLIYILRNHYVASLSVPS